jgi:hypothetical protein
LKEGVCEPPYGGRNDTSHFGFLEVDEHDIARIAADKDDG